MPPKPPHSLNSDAILQLEFDYASTTAHQAMEDRHKMVNFFLSVTGIVSSAIFAVHELQQGIDQNVAAFFSYVGFLVGFLFVINLIRLRQAWYESVRVMNRIKSYYFDNTDHPDLTKAFLWRENTLPKPEKGWTIFFFSVLLISFVDSILLATFCYLLLSEQIWIAFVCGGAVLLLQICLYFLMLKFNK